MWATFEEFFEFRFRHALAPTIVPLHQWPRTSCWSCSRWARRHQARNVHRKRPRSHGLHKMNKPIGQWTNSGAVKRRRKRTSNWHSTRNNIPSRPFCNQQQGSRRKIIWQTKARMNGLIQQRGFQIVIYPLLFC